MTRARNFPKFDAAGVFTRYNLNNVLGLAFRSSVCSKNAAFIAQEHGAFRTADLAAHELGHVLGAVNDGEINTCPNNGFIMGSLRNMMDEKIAERFRSFSPCSQSEISYHLGIVNSYPNNCLLTTYDTIWQKEMTERLKELIGSFR
ncbi:hypothetical protein HELRODRAFT_174074 [Helobdella robusta]|uniref:Peptidase M12B domain-containing protein n=1 Tax=Helobdella robusta TaxID=6412 RepID=T1F7K3_HELRO|nr:hypothetical protein HELRODRAFT_174074 [Helobdella robusta]ESO03174.1 hypothetical protein HELRODRAFT_174074 [Helobdella robusta]